MNVTFEKTAVRSEAMASVAPILLDASCKQEHAANNTSDSRTRSSLLSVKTKPDLEKRMHFVVCSILLVLVGPVLSLKNDGRPSIQDLFASSRIVENENAFLSCQVGGEGRMQFKWFFESQGSKKEIDQSDDHLFVTSLDALSILNIRSMTTDRSGSYTCQASNSLGSDSRTVNLKLNSKLIIWVACDLTIIIDYNRVQ